MSFLLCFVSCSRCPSGERVNDSHVWEIPEVQVSIIQKHLYHFTSPCFEPHRLRLIVTGSLRNALCRSPECFPYLSHTSMYRPGTEPSGPGVTGRGRNAGGHRGVWQWKYYNCCFSREQGGLFEAQNHKTLWRYLAVEVSETETCLFLLPGPDSSVFLSHSSCSIRGPLCWGGGMDCSWIQWNKLFLSWIVLNPIKSTVSYLNMKVHFNVTFPCHLIYSLYF